MHQISMCAGPPALLGWATGHLPEPANNPQLGMQNMRSIMPSLQKAKPSPLVPRARYRSVALPEQQRKTQIVKDRTVEDIAREIVEWALD